MAVGSSTVPVTVTGLPVTTLRFSGVTMLTAGGGTTTVTEMSSGALSTTPSLTVSRAVYVPGLSATNAGRATAGCGRGAVVVAGAAGGRLAIGIARGAAVQEHRIADQDAAGLVGAGIGDGRMTASETDPERKRA